MTNSSASNCLPINYSTARSLAAQFCVDRNIPVSSVLQAAQGPGHNHNCRRGTRHWKDLCDNLRTHNTPSPPPPPLLLPPFPDKSYPCLPLSFLVRWTHDPRESGRGEASSTYILHSLSSVSLSFLHPIGHPLAQLARCSHGAVNFQTGSGCPETIIGAQKTLLFFSRRRIHVAQSKECPERIKTVTLLTFPVIVSQNRMCV